MMELPSKIAHNRKSTVVLFAWVVLLLACNLLTRNSAPTRATPGFSEQPTSLSLPATGETEGTTSTPSSTSAAAEISGLLTVSNRYPLPHTTFVGFGLITTPGKVWVGSANGMVDVLDTGSGQVLQSIALFPDSGGMTPHPVFDLKFDGQHVWALTTSRKSDKPDTLSVIEATSGTVLRQFGASEWEGELEQKLGFSPGKIWLSHQRIDTRTFEVEYDVVPWGDYYAYDSTGWMWITVDWTISDCNPNLWVVNADDPAQHFPEWYLYKHGIVCGRPIASIGDQVWVAVDQQDGTDELWAYPSGGIKMTEETRPSVMVPSPDPRPIALIGNQAGLWMLGEETGYLYQFDPISGTLLNSLELYGKNERKTFSSNLALDDHDLWLSMTTQLWRIHLK